MSYCDIACHYVQQLHALAVLHVIRAWLLAHPFKAPVFHRITL